MKYNPDGQLYKITTVFSQFTLLNLLYIISATSKLYESHR